MPIEANVPSRLGRMSRWSASTCASSVRAAWLTSTVSGACSTSRDRIPSSGLCSKERWSRTSRIRLARAASTASSTWSWSPTSWRSTIVPRIARDYGHSLDTPPVCECAAWQLARQLGHPFDRLVAVTVYRAVGPPGSDPDSWLDGSLALKLEGAAMKGSAVKREVPDDAMAAGFFDALIGNQDRHPGQFRYDEPNHALGLLDHGFSFPVEAALCRGAYFQSFRRQEHPRLTEHERKLLRALVDDPELFGLAGVLEPDRAARLRWRAQRMLDLDVILLKGVV